MSVLVLMIALILAIVLVLVPVLVLVLAYACFQARQPTYGSVGEVSAGNEAHGSWDLEHPRGRKRGKNYRPIKG